MIDNNRSRPSEDEYRALMTFCDSQLIIDVEGSKPTCGTYRAQWNVEIDWCLLNCDTATLEFDINLPFIC